MYSGSHFAKNEFSTKAIAANIAPSGSSYQKHYCFLLNSGNIGNAGLHNMSLNFATNVG